MMHTIHNIDHPRRRVPGPVPMALQVAFDDIDPSREQQRLFLHDVTQFTRAEAQFLHDFMRDYSRAIDLVSIRNCTVFHAEDGCLGILQDCFAAAAKMTKIYVDFKCQKNVPDAVWFPSVTTFGGTLRLTLDQCGLGDDGFKKVVDAILGGSAKKTLVGLKVAGNDNIISSQGLLDVTRLVDQSHLRELDMDGDCGLLSNQDHVQLLCTKLKKNKFLKRLSFTGHSVPKGSTSKLVVMLAVNTTLTKVYVCGHDSNRLESYTRRNKRLATVLAGVQQLLLGLPNRHGHGDGHGGRRHHPHSTNNNTTISDGLWNPILKAALKDVDRDKSAFFLLLRHATVGSTARPLRALVMDAFHESPSRAAAQGEIDHLRAQVEVLQVDMRLLHTAHQAETELLQAKIKSLQADNASLLADKVSLQQDLVNMRAEQG